MDRSKITFAQAEGVEPLPAQLKTKTVSPHLTAMLWLIINGSLDDCLEYGVTGYDGGPWLGSPWKRILEDWWVFVKHQAIDEFPNALSIIAIVKREIRSTDYLQVYGFLEFLIRRPDLPKELRSNFELALEKARSPYRVVDNSIVEFATPEEAGAIIAAISEVAESGSNGARTHLRRAVDCMSNGDWAGTVRESIHAVESVARSIEPSATTLDPALTRLSKSRYIHPALSGAFSKLYGYTSDEQGVRHALVNEGTPKVTEADAKFMYGACASFCSYLLAMNGPREGNLVGN